MNTLKTIKLSGLTLLFFLTLNLNGQVSFISPDSLLKIINGPVSTEDTLVFNFWATWCGPCVEELPYFAKADSALASKHLRFIFVSMDGPSEMKKVKKFVLKKKMGGIQYLFDSADFSDFIQNADRKWQGQIPYTIVMKDGRRRNHYGNFASIDELILFITE